MLFWLLTAECTDGNVGGEERRGAQGFPEAKAGSSNRDSSLERNSHRYC